jgi:hypothetical protein
MSITQVVIQKRERKGKEKAIKFDLIVRNLGCIWF